MKNLIFVFLFAFLYLHICLAQKIEHNLVPNPSFEEYKNCPKSRIRTVNSKVLFLFQKTKLIPYWDIPTQGTSDYFNKCSVYLGVPSNFAGEQSAHSGDGYAGLIALKLDVTISGGKVMNYREYIQSKLLEPLRKNKLYYVRFYACLSTYSEYAINSLGIYFSPDKIKKRWDSNVISAAPQILWTDSSFIDSKEKWTLVQGIFKPDTDMNYITIGNFKDDTKRKKTVSKQVQQKNIIKFTSYYYIDDVSVELVNDSSTIFTTKKDTSKNISLSDSAIIIKNQMEENLSENKFNNVNIGQTIILKNIFFEYDKAILLSQSLQELDRLLSYLKDNPMVQVEIGGHTDSDGNDEYNQKLSEDRVKAATEYLIKKGIEKDRLIYKGYGEINPIADNATKEGRSMNRRVEFKILKN